MTIDDWAILVVVLYLGFEIGRATKRVDHDLQSKKRKLGLALALSYKTSRERRNALVTPIKDFAETFQDRVKDHLPRMEALVLSGNTLWWMTEAAKDILIREAGRVEFLRDTLRTKAEKVPHALLRYDDVDKLLAIMQEGTETSVKAMSDAQQTLEGSPESAVPQARGQ